MNINRKVYTAAAGVLAACLAAATASAQNFMVYQYGASAGAVSQVSVANLAPNWVATGVRNSAGVMEVITWESNGTQLVRKGSATGNVVDNTGISTVALSPTRVITAGISDGLVELMSWTVNASGAVEFFGYVTNESAKSISLAKLDSSRVIAAVEDITGALTMTVFLVSSDGAVSYGGADPTYEQVSLVGIAAISGSQVVSAVRNSAGDLQLDSWLVGTDDLSVHQETASAGAVSLLDITAWDSGHVATPVRNSAGDLELIDWAVNPTTGAIARESSKTVGASSQVAASTIGGLIFTASVNSSGRVDAGVWGYNGTQIEEGVSTQEEAATAVAAAPPSTLSSRKALSRPSPSFRNADTGVSRSATWRV